MPEISCIALPDALRRNAAVIVDRQAEVSADVGRPGIDGAELIQGLALSA